MSLCNNSKGLNHQMALWGWAQTAVKITVTKNVVASPSIHQETSFEDLVQDVDQQVCGKVIQICTSGGIALLPAAHSLASRKCCYHTSSGNSRDLTVPKFQVMYFQKRKSQSQFLHSCERLMLIYSQSTLGWFPDPFLLEEESSQTVVIAVDVSRGFVNKYGSWQLPAHRAVCGCGEALSW